MKIAFGMNADNAMHAVFYVWSIFICILFQIESVDKLDRAQESVYMIQMPNATSVRPYLFCHISYNDCQCSTISTKDCLSDKDLKGIRVVPLILFVLEIYLIRALLSLSGNYINIVAYIGWFVCVFTFISILIVIYCKSSYYGYMITMLIGAGMFLYGFVNLEVARDKELVRPFANSYIVSDIEISESVGNSG